MGGVEHHFVGLGYALLLAKLYHLEGSAWTANALIHYITPALGLIYWIAFVRKGVLNTIGLLRALYAVGFLVVLVDKRWAKPGAVSE